MNSIGTERTMIRRLEPNDFENLRVLESDPLVMQFTRARVPQTDSQTRDRLTAQISRRAELDPFGIWVAETKSNRDFVGWFMLMPQRDSALELGFMLSQGNWGQGFATEICGALINFAQSQGVPRLVAISSLRNLASLKVLKKSGFLELEKRTSPEAAAPGEVDLLVFELKLLS